jgi:hypothetical protein
MRDIGLRSTFSQKQKWVQATDRWRTIAVYASAPLQKKHGRFLVWNDGITFGAQVALN